MCLNLKYNIKDRLRKLPEGTITTNTYIICITLGISETTWQTWCKIPLGSATSIKSDKLFQLAEIFKCDARDLINQLNQPVLING